MAKKIVPEKKKCKDKWYQKLYKTLFYDSETRTVLSRTALMNFVFFIMAITLFIIGIILAFNGKNVPKELYLYVGGLTGGGFLQYSYGKNIVKK